MVFRSISQVMIRRRAADSQGGHGRKRTFGYSRDQNCYEGADANMRYYVLINNAEYEVEVDQGKVGVISTREVAHRSADSADAPAPSVAETKARPSGQVQAHAHAEMQPQTQAQAARPAPVGTNGGEIVKAPMPGTILDVKVNTGDTVKRGQVMLILEAMKMENEIVAPADGTIIQIRAARGTSVNAGDVLAILQ